MTALKNFINKVLDDRRIYTAEDIAQMSGDEFSQNEKSINYQMNNLGIPRERDLIGNTDVVYVRAYTKDDGTKVKAHYRSKPDGIISNNSANQYRQSYRTNSTPTGAVAGASQSKIGDGVCVLPELLTTGISYFDGLSIGINMPMDKYLLTENNDYFKNDKALKTKKKLDWGVNKFGKAMHQDDAVAFWNIASNFLGINSNDDYIKRNGKLYNGIDSLGSEFSQYKVQIKEKVKAQFKTIDDAPGIVFHENSSVANAIIKSSEMKNFIDSNYEKLKSGKTVSGSFGFKKLSNLYDTFGIIDVLSAKKRGNVIDIIMLDTYDFNKNSRNFLVQMGRSVQEAGLLNPYFTIVKCKYTIPEEVTNE